LREGSGEQLAIGNWPNPASRRFVLINADQKNLPRMNAKRRESNFNFLIRVICEIRDSVFGIS
jgi:hypothetical protein